VWSPGWPTADGIFKRVSVCPIETFDSGATPKPGEKRKEPKNVADVDLDALRKTMAATIERAKENDPKILKRRIAELEKDLAKKPDALEKNNTLIKTREVPVLKDGQLKRAEKIIDRIESLARAQQDRFAREFSEALEALAPLKSAIGNLQTKSAPGVTLPAHSNAGAPTISRPPAAVVARQQAPPPPRVEPRRSASLTPAAGDSSNVNLGSGERRCAIAIAQHLPNGCAREQLTTLTGFKRSTRNTYLQRLTAAGLVAQSGERFVITQAGLDWIGTDYEPLPTGAALQSYWLNKLPQGESIVLQVVLENPAGIDRDSIGEKTSFKRSTRNTYIQRLAARELVKVRGEIIEPSEALFD
jgi:uncharacterized protein